MTNKKYGKRKPFSLRIMYRYWLTNYDKQHSNVKMLITGENECEVYGNSVPPSHFFCKSKPISK